MKKFALLLLAFLPLMADAQLSTLIHQYSDMYYPGEIAFRDGRKVEYALVELPKARQREITTYTSKKKTGKQNFNSQDIFSVTVWLDESPGIRSTLYYVNADRNGKRKRYQDYWGIPVAASAWGVLLRCYTTYTMDKKSGELLGDYYYSSMSGGAMTPNGCPCVLVRHGETVGTEIGRSYPNMSDGTVMIWDFLNAMNFAWLFSENTEIEERIYKKQKLEDLPIQQVLEIMAETTGMDALAVDEDITQPDTLSSADVTTPLSPAAIAANQGLKQSVCVVCPVYTVSDSVLMSEYARVYGRLGMSDDATQLSSYASGTFGSGVVIALDSQLYVLTNRHVAGYAKEVKIVLPFDEQEVVFEHCPVFSSYKKADLALVQLPAEAAAVCKALPVTEGNIVDGEPIIAAGFPGLNNNPSWQMTKGEISNAALSIERGALPLIQHTAPIDPGSSGGPLLRLKEEGYEIIGINTLKMRGRERVGVAVGAEDISNFIATLSKPDKSDQQTLHRLWAYNVDKLPAQFASIPRDKQKKLADKPTVLPLDKALSIWKQTKTKPMSREEAEKNEQKALSGLLSRTREPGLVDDTDHRFAISAQYDHFFNGNSNASLIFDINSRYLRQYVSVGAALYNIYSESETVLAPGISVVYGIGGQLPVLLADNHFLTPYITVGIGPALQLSTKISNVNLMFIPQLRAGADYEWSFGNAGLILGVGYLFQPTAAFQNDLKLPLIGRNVGMQHALSVKLGVAF